MNSAYSYEKIAYILRTEEKLYMYSIYIYVFFSEGTGYCMLAIMKNGNIAVVSVLDAAHPHYVDYINATCKMSLSLSNHSLLKLQLPSHSIYSLIAFSPLPST